MSKRALEASGSTLTDSCSGPVRRRLDHDWDLIPLAGFPAARDHAESASRDTDGEPLVPMLKRNAYPLMDGARGLEWAS
jgi:hypothetical protein